MVAPGLDPPGIDLADIKAFMAQDRAGWEPLVKASGARMTTTHYLGRSTVGP
jgi:hypothetical protein